MFKERYREENERIKPTPEARRRALQAVRQAAQQPILGKYRYPRRWKPAAVAAFCALLLIAGIFAATSPLLASQDAGKLLPVNTEPLSGLDGYETLYTLVTNISHNSRDFFADTGESMAAVAEDGAIPETGMATGAAPDAETEGTAEELNPENDYSGTNLQVEDVDEADTAKTDGAYLYRLQNNTLSILSCEGASAKLLSQTKVAAGEASPKPAEGEGSVNETAVEMYLAGDRLIVIKTVYVWKDTDHGWEAEDYTAASVYDIADRTAPSLITEFRQDGAYLTSRLSDGVLYLLSNDSPDTEPIAGEPGTYVPCTYDGGTAVPVAAEAVYVVPNPDTTRYTVISSVDAATGTMIDNQSVLGARPELYMTGETLYLARTVYDSEAGDPFTEDGYEVQEFHDTVRTELLRFSLQSGQIDAASQGEVPGRLLNQFSMDEYDGHLRVVTTWDESTYRVYTDQKHGWVNYQPGDNLTENALYVLDSDLHVTGRLEGLAEDERVYSVRFSGAVGYFVTFRETDPLFTVDLSDPTEPEITSQLKIPGFSSYLHVYGDSLLFGIGMDADEETDETHEMKLSMFDISDPYDVTEKHTMLLDIDWSEALYNHKAILISPERDLIAFPAGAGYEIYGYSETTGFYRKASVDGDLDWSGGDARGLYSGDCFYVCTGDMVTVFRMDNFSKLTQIAL